MKKTLIQIFGVLILAVTLAACSNSDDDEFVCSDGTTSVNGQCLNVINGGVNNNVCLNRANGTSCTTNFGVLGTCQNQICITNNNGGNNGQCGAWNNWCNGNNQCGSWNNWCNGNGGNQCGSWNNWCQGGGHHNQCVWHFDYHRNLWIQNCGGGSVIW